MRLSTLILAGALSLAVSPLSAGSAPAAKGSIKTGKEHMLDFPFLAKISVERAIKVARKAVPDGVPAYAYQLADNGYLTWTIWMGMKDKSQMQVDIDAGNGKILGVKPVVKDKKDDMKEGAK